MKLRSSFLLAIAIAAPLMTGLSLHLNTQPSWADDGASQTEMRGRRGQWKNLSPEEREAKRAEKAAKFKQALGLSDRQSSQIEAIREKYEPQRQALHDEFRTMKESGNSDGREALHLKKQALHEQMRDEIKAVLTPEQQEKLATFKAQHQRHGNGKHSQPDR